MTAAAGARHGAPDGGGRTGNDPHAEVPGSAVRNPSAERRSMVLDGHKVRYWFYDVDPDPKPLIVLVHGFRGDHHGLQLIADRLRGRYHVVVPDLPGFGRSEPFPDRPHDIAGYAQFLRGFVETLTDGAVHDGARHGVAVLGHSFGSVVAAHFAAAHPAMVERLVLVNPICEPALEGGPALLSRLTAAYYRLGRALPRRLGHRLLSSWLVTDAMSGVMTTSRDPRVRSYVRHQHRAYFSAFADRDVLLEAYEASVSHTVAEVAMQLSMPTLLVVGAQDELGSVAAQRTMASWIPRHRLEVLEGVGHLIHYEAPGRTAELVHDFLSAPAPDPVPAPEGEPPALHAQAPPAEAPDTAPFTGLQRIVRRAPRGRRGQQGGRRR
ncbi:alpha/beta fold hydrolase [Kocuria sp. CH-021]|jgi:pimeloyl-ACP methyl ester carboxylesterase|uniref:alpha/beta fold hydrolase n=1 Tax=Kocuria sp. CH-021 TaxID=3406735 RepID=UPI003C71941C